VIAVLKADLTDGFGIGSVQAKPKERREKTRATMAGKVEGHLGDLQSKINHITPTYSRQYRKLWSEEPSNYLLLGAAPEGLAIYKLSWDMAMNKV
jgi:hypothetical protein